MNNFVKIIQFINRLYKGLQIVILKSSWHRVGKNVRFFPGDSYFHYENISIGDDVYIGPRATFVSSDSSISIGNKVMFGPNVTITTGDHTIGRTGVFIKDNRNKSEHDDLPVFIEDDVWVGANVTILKGVKIGRGAVIAAGALVTKDVPPYVINGGVPARILKHRFTKSEVLRHEEYLYPLDLRLTENELDHLPQ